MKPDSRYLIQQAEATTRRLCAQLSMLFGAKLGRISLTRLGRCIAHYELRKKIGGGAMGAVYLAWDRKCRQLVAIKVLGRRDPESRQRFRREALCAAALRHPNIVRIQDVIRQGAVDAIVMEYVRGRTLDQVVSGHGLAIPTFLDYAQQIAVALAAVHNAGMIYRDLKPANIKVRKNGAIVLLDFGMVKIVDKKLIRPILGSGQQLPTLAGTIMGTAGYMAPEQVRGQPADQRSDVFGLGAIFYHMLTSRSPFSRRTPIETLSAILHQAPRRSPRRVPAAIAKIVLRCLAKEPHRRYRTAKEVALDLARAAQVLGMQDQAAASRRCTRRCRR